MKTTKIYRNFIPTNKDEAAPILWIFRGFPGSGKTTLSNRFGCLVVEPFDHISRIAGKYNWNPEGRSCKEQAYSYVYDAMELALTHNMDIAVSEVLPTIEDVNTIINGWYGTHFDIRVVEMPPITVEQSMARSVHNVKPEDIQRMHEQWEPYPNALTPQQALESVGIKQQEHHRTSKR